MSLGSALWGQIATQFDIPIALMAAAGGAVLAIPFTWRAKLQHGVAMDLSPSMHWPEPVVSDDVQNDRGPVMTTVEYQVDLADSAEFLSVITELSRARRRGGAFAWGVVEDAAKPGRFLEYFMESSWLEHLRHHERVTEADRQVQERLLDLHKGDERPLVNHFLAPDLEGPAGAA